MREKNGDNFFNRKRELILTAMVYRGSPRKTIIIIICSAFETYWSSSLDLSKILFCLGNLTRTEFHLQFKPVSFKFVANYFIRFVYHLTLKKKKSFNSWETETVEQEMSPPNDSASQRKDQS